MRLTNNVTSDSARLSLTVSKPPFGVAGIIGANNQVDLAEGTTLAPVRMQLLPFTAQFLKSNGTTIPTPGILSGQ
jgi:hypothetical protein